MTIATGYNHKQTVDSILENSRTTHQAAHLRFIGVDFCEDSHCSDIIQKWIYKY
jgi:hypothetical protein